MSARAEAAVRAGAGGGLQPGAQAAVQARAETGAAPGVQPGPESAVQVWHHAVKDLLMGTQ